MANRTSKKNLRVVEKSNAPKKPKTAKKTRKRTKKPTKIVKTTIVSLKKLSFYASIARTNQTQSATTLDNNYSLTVKTHDSNIMDLGKVPPLTLVRVTVEVVEDSDRLTADPDKDKYYER